MHNWTFPYSYHSQRVIRLDILSLTKTRDAKIFAIMINNLINSSKVTSIKCTPLILVLMKISIVVKKI